MQITPFFWSFNRIRTHGLCVSASVLYHLSYMKTHTLEAGQFVDFILKHEDDVNCENTIFSTTALKQRRWVRITWSNEYFFRVYWQLLKLQLPMQRSYLHQRSSSSCIIIVIVIVIIIIIIYLFIYLFLYLDSPAFFLMLPRQTLLYQVGMRCRKFGPLDPGIGPLHMHDSWIHWKSGHEDS